jgi:CRISPR-associated protein Cas1
MMLLTVQTEAKELNMYRQIVIKNSCKISIKNNSLVIKWDKEYKIPLEDISVIILESRDSIISSYTLSEINNNNILLLTCNDKHLINGHMHSVCANYKSSSVLKHQINLSKVTRNNLWKKIIERKIYNQSICLDKLDIDGGDKLKGILKDVKSNDRSNREAYAANIYFKHLFNKEFTRREDNAVNSALNYCYSIIRSNIVRYCYMYGLNTELGIFHDNELNNFNLADDLIEPIRPFVDLYVMSIKDKYDELNSKFKNDLMNINNYEMELDGKNYRLDKIIDLYVRSFKSCVVSNDFELIKIPVIKELKLYSYE